MKEETAIERRERSNIELCICNGCTRTHKNKQPAAMVYMIEPQLPWLSTATYHTDLDVKMIVTLGQKPHVQVMDTYLIGGGNTTSLSPILSG